MSNAEKKLDEVLGVAYDVAFKDGVNQTCMDLIALWAMICDKNGHLNDVKVNGLDGKGRSLNDLLLDQLEDYKRKRGE